jgi:hypothetical protein
MQLLLSRSASAAIKFHYYLRGKGLGLQLLIFWGLVHVPILIAAPVEELLYALGLPEYMHQVRDADEKTFIVGILLGPVFETWLIQFLVYKLLAYFKLNSPKIYIPLASTLFAVMHDMHIVSLLYTGMTGAVLCYVYYFYRHDTRRAFWSTALIHALRNITAFIGTYLLLG